MTQTIESAGLTFLCDDPLEVWRAQTLAEKEPGTLIWLNELGAGDTLYDVGANIGVYSLYAAKRGVRVFAFEPHAVSAMHLARNAKENGLNNITVYNSIVGVFDGIQWYRYHSFRPGSATGPALEKPRLADKPEVWISSIALDSYIGKQSSGGKIFVKVDTDGDELSVLSGAMKSIQKGLVDSYQIEVSPHNAEEIHNYMRMGWYAPVKVHYTSNGEAAIKNGADPATVICNTIFRRK